MPGTLLQETLEPNTEWDQLIANIGVAGKWISCSLLNMKMGDIPLLHCQGGDKWDKHERFLRLETHFFWKICEGEMSLEPKAYRLPKPLVRLPCW